MKNKIRKIINKTLSFKVLDFIVLPIIALIIAFIIVVPKINLIGDKIVEVEYKTTYKDSGATAKFIGKDITKDLKKKQNVNTNKLGDYQVKYSLNNFAIPINKTRKVVVVDKTKPDITLTGDEVVYVCPGSKYIEEGYTAKDKHDGNLTKKVKVKKEDDKITYTVVDSSKNKREVVREILYQDKQPPVFNLNGIEEVTMVVGNTYNDPGYTISDNCDTDMVTKVTTEGTVDTNTPGTYVITYIAKDNAGNETKVERKVIVNGKVSADSGVRKPGVIYLTFDDGPQDGTTNVILDILKEEGVKATFFVTNKGPDELIKREADEGHTVALHTASHDYSIVYASADSYFNDLQIVHDRVQRITGLDARIIRFPGGSSNTVSRRYSNGIMSFLTQEVLNRGYRYYDWNVSSGDAGATTDPNEIYNNVVNSLSHDRPNMVLMHDIKTYTRDALRNIIKYGKDNGYTFEAITTNTAMVRQRVNN